MISNDVTIYASHLSEGDWVNHGLMAYDKVIGVQRRSRDVYVTYYKAGTVAYGALTDVAVLSKRPRRPDARRAWRQWLSQAV